MGTDSVGARRRLAALGAVLALLVVVPAAAANIATKPLVTWQTNGRVLAIHTIKIVCMGTHGHPTIDVDAFLTVR